MAKSLVNGKIEGSVHGLMKLLSKHRVQGLGERTKAIIQGNRCSEQDMK
jgi:hypothetical protein